MAQQTTADRAEYHVERARRAAPPVPHRAGARGPLAILIAHGMGQQIPFQTMEAVAEGLLRTEDHRSAKASRYRGAAEAARHGARRGHQAARTVVVGGERLQRLELDVPVGDGATREVHIYEGYWAPLTEGQVRLRDVTAFLFRGGISGIQLGLRDFRRWMFGEYVRFAAPVRAVLYMLVALSVVSALVFLNIALTAIAVARAPLSSPPAWLSDVLFRDVTTILNALICALTPLVAILGWAVFRRNRVRGPLAALGIVSVAAFVLALWGTITAALLVAAAFVFHVSDGAGGTASLFGPDLAALAARFNARFDTAATVLASLVVLVAAGRFVLMLTRELAVALRQKAATRALTLRVLLGFVVVFGAAAAIAVAVSAERLRGIAGAWHHAIAWPLFIGISLVVRWLLIQFAGDVAAYIQPQTLDRFYALRQQIKDAVGRVATAVYSDAQYQDIILVGHSLGSVVIYDVLNRLILDRQLAGAAAPEVVKRTRLLLTFGSPLDKTAFIFGTQGSGREAREALAASVQPLITDPAVRPKWINIWSPWDIISGHLDYYDLPDKSNPNPVENIVDKRAGTLLVAHVEYWTNPLLFDQLRAHLT